VAVLFSGGLDSAILLAHLLADRRRVRPLYVESGLVWQTTELRFARRYLQAIDAPGLEPLVVLDLPLADVYGDHWSVTGRGVPTADEPDERVYLPGRNPLLLIKADVWCRLQGVGQLALGALESNPFADATDAFFASFTAAMDHAGPGRVEVVRPLAALDKRHVMQLGTTAPLELTFSCLAPQGELHCGACNKCAERRRAFRDAGIEDPTTYSTSPPRTVAV
jgi:7-cyano-7-deazaguanine synthase